MSRVLLLALTLLLVASRAHAAEQPAIPAETGGAAKARHERVAERRKGPGIICHRGASEHAHENTLEAFRATFLLGGDGNEFDIRTTSDGVLVVFHDDMLDRLLETYGDVGDFTWAENSSGSASAIPARSANGAASRRWWKSSTCTASTRA